MHSERARLFLNVLRYAVSAHVHFNVLSLAYFSTLLISQFPRQPWKKQFCNI